MRTVVFLALSLSLANCGEPGPMFQVTLEIEARSGADVANDLALVLDVLEARVDDLGLRGGSVEQVGNNRILVEFSPTENNDAVLKTITLDGHPEFRIGTDGASFIAQLDRIDRAIVDEVPEATPRSGAPGPLSALLSKGRLPGQFLVEPEDKQIITEWLGLEAVATLIPTDITLNWGAVGVTVGGVVYVPLYVLDAAPILTGDMVKDARVERDATFDELTVVFEMTDRGADALERGTTRNLNEYMAIVLSDLVRSYSVIQAPLSQHGQISLGARTSRAEAEYLAYELHLGWLPVPLIVLDARMEDAGPAIPSP